MRISDWSSDVCSSDLAVAKAAFHSSTHPPVYRPLRIGRPPFLPALRRAINLMNANLFELFYAGAAVNDRTDHHAAIANVPLPIVATIPLLRGVGIARLAIFLPDALRD